jgi:hypothetical protein
MIPSSVKCAGQALTASNSQCASPLVGGTVFYVPREGFSVSWTADRAQVAALIRHHPDDPSLADDGRRRLKLAKARRLIRSLAEPPALTIEQRAGLAALLLGSAGGDGDVAA